MMGMSRGAAIVVTVSIVLSIASLLDGINADGFMGYSYSVGLFLGGFLIYAFIGFILLFIVRHIEKHLWRKEGGS